MQANLHTDSSILKKIFDPLSFQGKTKFQSSDEERIYNFSSLIIGIITFGFAHSVYHGYLFLNRRWSKKNSNHSNLKATLIDGNIQIQKNLPLDNSRNEDRPNNHSSLSSSIPSSLPCSISLTESHNNSSLGNPSFSTVNQAVVPPFCTKKSNNETETFYSSNPPSKTISVSANPHPAFTELHTESSYSMIEDRRVINTHDETTLMQNMPTGYRENDNDEAASTTSPSNEVIKKDKKKSSKVKILKGALKGAAKGVVKGAVKGAVKGVVKGVIIGAPVIKEVVMKETLKGAAKGAVKEGIKGGVRSYKKGKNKQKKAE